MDKKEGGGLYRGVKVSVKLLDAVIIAGILLLGAVFVLAVVTAG